MANPSTETEPGELYLSDLARAVVGAVAPEQAALFGEVAAAWWAGDLDDRPGVRGRLGTIGSGLAADALVYLVFPILTGALAQVLGEQGARRWRLRRRRRVDLAVSAALLARAEEIRDACVARSVSAGVGRGRAELIGDAVYAAVARAARRERDSGPHR